MKKSPDTDNKIKKDIVFFILYGGKIENVFKSGTYKLTTENFPFLRGLVKPCTAATCRTQYVTKITSLPFGVNWYFDFQKIANRCRVFLNTAKEYADDSELEQILQLDSALTSQIEAIANDDSISKKQEKK